MQSKNTNDLNNLNKPKTSGNKRGILVGIIICIVLIIILIFLVIYFRGVDATTFKLYVDDSQVSIKDDFYFLDDDGNPYVKLKDIASFIDWSYQNGEYGAYTEDSDSGYIQNDYEVCSFVTDSYVINKYIIYDNSRYLDEEEAEEVEDEEEEETVITVNSDVNTKETIELNLPILEVNDLIYAPLECLDDICNSLTFYSEYRMEIYEMNYMLTLSQKNAAAFGYEAVSGTYENIRALPYGVMVVQNSSGDFGVVDLFDQSQDPILGFKYQDIIFNQGIKEFMVKTSTSRVGIIDLNGDTIISPLNYDSIKVLDDELNLYLIEKDKKYGVINRDEDVIIYPEYTSIGLSDEVKYLFSDSDDNNSYSLFEDTIVVEDNGKYGFYNFDGENTLKVNYEGIGYITEEDHNNYLESIEEDQEPVDEDTDAQKGNSVLTMNIEFSYRGEDAIVKGIVVEQTALNGESLYGIYDTIQERLIIPCACTRIYSVIDSNSTLYYLEYNGVSYEFIDYIYNHPNDNLFTYVSDLEGTTSDELEEMGSEEEVETVDTNEEEIYEEKEDEEEIAENETSN